MEKTSSFKNFDSVWQRVSESHLHSEKPAGGNDRVVLQYLIQAEHEAMSLYKCLARKTKGRNSRLFSQLALDEQRHIKRLEFEYFLLVGDNYVPAAFVCPRDGVMSLVHKAFVDESEAEKSYLNYAGSASSKNLQRLYLSLSADENRHAGILRNILKNAIN